MVWGLAHPVTFGGELEFAHRFYIKREQVGLGAVIKAHANGPVLIGAVPWFVIIGTCGDVFDKEAAVFDVIVELAFVDVTAP